jgi:HAD superfamily hydrolase (TIGR01484 family)
MLSVQVHPSDANKELLPEGETGKTEAWVVLETGANSRIYSDLKPGTTKNVLRLALANGSVVNDLASFVPKPGDAVFTPAGTVHALGGDIVVFEIQENSDVTFRLYDWGHIEAKTDKPRSLQVDQALECITFVKSTAGLTEPVMQSTTPVERESIFQCRAFRLWRLRGLRRFLSANPNARACWYALRAQGRSNMRMLRTMLRRAMRCWCPQLLEYVPFVHAVLSTCWKLPCRNSFQTGDQKMDGGARSSGRNHKSSEEYWVVKKLIVFDLDGTLAESKSSLDEQMSVLLHSLLGVVKVAAISGGDWPQFEKQLLSHLPHDESLENLSLLPTCGTKFYRYVGHWEKLYEEDFCGDQKRKIITSLKKALGAAGYKVGKVWGVVIEDRGSQITFSALGQQAPLMEKDNWDPDYAKRKKIKAILDTYIPEFSVRMGGSTSIDVTKPGIDKAYGIRKLQEILGTSLKEMIYVGDAIFVGGNDYPAK